MPVVGISGMAGGQVDLAERLAAGLGLEPEQVVERPTRRCTAALRCVEGSSTAGLSRAATRDWFDLTVWIDIDPERPGSRAVARNVLQGDDAGRARLWDTKWIPEGHDYERAGATAGAGRPRPQRPDVTGSRRRRGTGTLGSPRPYGRGSSSIGMCPASG